MKVVFMGTPDFAVYTLTALIESKYDVIAVVTQPDKPKGRGKAVISTPVKQKALENNIKVYQPIKVKSEEFIEEFKKLNPDVIVVTAFGQILPKEILDIPKYGCINVHASLLPKYRGAAPIQWVIINGEKETGITTMYMDTGLDTGDMILKQSVDIDEKETGESLHDKLANISGKILIDTLDLIQKGKANFEKQDDKNSCYAKMLTKELGNIDFNKSAIEIERLIRGLNSWPSAYTKFNNKTLKIWEANVINQNSNEKCGTIVNLTKDSIIVQTKDGQLEITQLQLEGKKRMNTSEFLKGHEIKLGTLLGE